MPAGISPHFANLENQAVDSVDVPLRQPDVAPDCSPHFSSQDEHYNMSSRGHRRPRRLHLEMRQDTDCSTEYTSESVGLAQSDLVSKDYARKLSCYQENNWIAEDDVPGRIGDSGCVVNNECNTWQEPVGHSTTGTISRRSEEDEWLPSLRSSSQGLNFGTIHGEPGTMHRGYRRCRWGGDRRRGRDSSPDPKDLPCRPQKGDWLPYLPGLEIERSSRGSGVTRSDDLTGANKYGLSRLFDYAFAGSRVQQGSTGATGLAERARKRGQTSESLDTTHPCSQMQSASDSPDRRSNQRYPHSQIPSPPPPDRQAMDGTKATMVGVTIRRPPSPQFSFLEDSKNMDEHDVCDAVEPHIGAVRQNVAENFRDSDDIGRESSMERRMEHISTKGTVGCCLVAQERYTTHHVGEEHAHEKDCSNVSTQTRNENATGYDTLTSSCGLLESEIDAGNGHVLHHASPKRDSNPRPQERHLRLVEGEPIPCARVAGEAQSTAVNIRHRRTGGFSAPSRANVPFVSSPLKRQRSSMSGVVEQERKSSSGLPLGAHISHSQQDGSIALGAGWVGFSQGGGQAKRIRRNMEVDVDCLERETPGAEAACREARNVGTYEQLHGAEAEVEIDSEEDRARRKHLSPSRRWEERRRCHRHCGDEMTSCKSHSSSHSMHESRVPWNARRADPERQSNSESIATRWPHPEKSTEVSTIEDVAAGDTDAGVCENSRKDSKNSSMHTSDPALKYDLDALGGEGVSGDMEEPYVVSENGGELLEAFLPTEACDR